MTDKFWVTGGNGLWSSTGNWSLSSGGSSGAAIPLNVDDVFIDDMSGGGTVEVDGTTGRACRDLNFTGFTGTFQMGGNGNTLVLQILGEVTFVAAMTLVDGSGTELVYMWWVDDTGGENQTSAGKTIPWECRFFSANAAIFNLVDDWVFTNTVRVHPTSDTSIMTMNGSSMEIQGADYYAGNGNGNTVGTTKIKLTGTGTLFLNTGVTTYYHGLDIDFTSGTRTVSGDGGVGGGAKWTYVSGTLIFEQELDGLNNDPCYINLTNGQLDLDLGTSAYNIPRVLAKSSNVTLLVSNTGGNLTIADFRVTANAICTITNQQTNALIIDTWNDLSTGLTNPSNQFYNGDITFGKFYVEWTTTDADFTFDDTSTYTFKERFELLKADDGKELFTSSHGVNKTTFHIWHACRTHLYGSDWTRIDALSIGQGLDAQGEAVITECFGVNSEISNKAVFGLTGSAPNITRVQHQFYTDPVANPVTISGTVELSATPQANALVFVVSKTTENGKDWFKLINILITDASGEWQTNVPAGTQIFIEIHYDTGAQKYNSLTKPYIEST